MNKRLSVAVVGLGIGKSHIREAYRKHVDKFDISAICDVNPDTLKSVGDSFGIEKRLTSFEDVLADPATEIVDICTPPFTHYDMIVQALDAGKSVICEKPLVGSLREVDHLIERERKGPGRVMPIFQFRYGTGAAQARALIQSGIVGRPQVATVETMWNRAPSYYQVPWRAKWKTELGGVLTSQAIHAHDLLSHLLGPVRSVFARTDTRQYDMEIEDTATINALLDNAMLVSMTATVSAAEETTRLRLIFENVTLESGHSPYNPGGAPWTILVRRPELQAEVDQILVAVGVHEDRFSGQMLRYYDAVHSGAPLPVTLHEGRASIELATAIHYSARTHTEVTLPIGRQHPYYGGWAI